MAAAVPRPPLLALQDTKAQDAVEWANGFRHESPMYASYLQTLLRFMMDQPRLVPHLQAWILPEDPANPLDESIRTFRAPDITVMEVWRPDMPGAGVIARYHVLIENKAKDHPTFETVQLQLYEQAAYLFASRAPPAMVVGVCAIGDMWQWGILARAPQTPPRMNYATTKDWYRTQDRLQLVGEWSHAIELGSDDSDFRWRWIIEHVVVPNMA